MQPTMKLLAVLYVTGSVIIVGAPAISFEGGDLSWSTECDYRVYEVTPCPCSRPPDYPVPAHCAMCQAEKEMCGIAVFWTDAPVVYGVSDYLWGYLQLAPVEVVCRRIYRCNYVEMDWARCGYAAPGATYCDDEGLDWDPPPPGCRRCVPTELDPEYVQTFTWRVCESAE